MLIAAFFSRVGIPLDRDRLLRDLLLVHRVKMHVVSTETDDLLVLDKIDFSGIFQYRRHIRRDKAAILILPHDQRTILSDRKDLIGMVCEQDPKCIGSLHAVHDFCDRLQRISVVIIIEQMRQHFRVRIGDKPVSL